MACQSAAHGDFRLLLQTYPTQFFTRAISHHFLLTTSAVDGAVSCRNTGSSLRWQARGHIFFAVSQRDPSVVSGKLPANNPFFVEFPVCSEGRCVRTVPGDAGIWVGLPCAWDGPGAVAGPSDQRRCPSKDYWPRARPRRSTFCRVSRIEALSPPVKKSDMATIEGPSRNR